MNKQGKEILWNIINSLLAGALVLCGAFADGQITNQGIIIAISASFIVAINQFKDFWSKEQQEYCGSSGEKKLFTFIS